MKLSVLYEDYRSGPYNYPFDCCTRSQAKYGPIDYFPHDDAPPIYKHRRKGRKKTVKEGVTSLLADLKALRPLMAQAAQGIYNEWDDAEGFGICDEIQSEMAGVIGEHIEANIEDGGHDGDDHAFLIVSRGNERYWVDIPSRVYESGGGYSWKKIPGVVIQPSDVVIAAI